MRIGFVVNDDEMIVADALTAAEGLVELAQESEIVGAKGVALIDFEGRDGTEHGRGQLGDAFEVLDRLIALNPCHSGSLRYAMEEMLEDAFRAGQEYERKRLKK